MSNERMPVAVKNSPRANEKFVTYVMHIAGCLTGNVSCANPTPSVASLIAQATLLAQANVQAKGGGTGVVADRDLKRKDLEEDIDHLVDYVQGNIKALGLDATAAAAMILSTGLSIRKTTTAAKPPLSARPGLLPGVVLVVARALANAHMYYWEFSLDLKVWSSVTETAQAHTTVSGLTPGQVYYFRFYTRTRKGLGDYSDAVKCMVH
jgi:hypothetical protein